MLSRIALALFFILTSPVAFAWHPYRLVGDADQTGFVVLSGDVSDQIEGGIRIRQRILAGLPGDVKPVFTVTSAEDVSKVKDAYKDFVSPDRLGFILVPSNDQTWWISGRVRPIWIHSEQGPPELRFLQDYNRREVIWSGEVLAAFEDAGSELLFTGYENSSWSPVSDLEGRCVVLEQTHFPDWINDIRSYFQYYGCSQTLILPNPRATPDVQNQVLLLSKGVAVTHVDEFVPLLTSLGLTVRTVPKVGNGEVSYVNAIVVNQTIFVPQFGIASDIMATQLYSSLGYEVIPVPLAPESPIARAGLRMLRMNLPPGRFVSSY